MIKIVISTIILFCQFAFANEEVVIDPIFSTFYMCGEHPKSENMGLGDALGSDCMVYQPVEVNGRRWMRAYTNEGFLNSDWYGWRQTVHAPVSGLIKKIHINEVTNEPGIPIIGIASYIMIQRDDGVVILLAHVREVEVVEGQTVKVGQPIAKVGNNGNSFHPHIHLGAYRDKTPLQIRFNLSSPIFGRN